ncbi:MAG: hypothetical protein Q8916_04475 [Bacteroidota bacterium]|nr:hypothetical protein [Bacteroidota bacterium]MDP4229644.1 hypothetical protein [Bacteroidota bacterium]MDP4237552.1 hypothetical protein [Bacteroidota bacterium]
MKKVLYLSILAFFFVLVLSENSSAIPAFARKYKTSCATCHVGFPKLNAFGDAFRRNGYQFPGHTDAEFTKDEEVSLGAEGNKKSFPDAIWPGTIPSHSPISLFLNGEIDYNPKTIDGDPSTNARWSFSGLGNAIETAIGGTLGEDMAFWGQASFSSEGLELNRIFLSISNIIGDSYALNARIGVFEPQLFSFSTHRAWMEGYWLTTRAFGDADHHDDQMGWTLEEHLSGIEVNGMAADGRLFYSAGIVEGFGPEGGPLHSDKDFYGHLSYKVGGLPLDGVTAGGPNLNNLQPYVDNSFTIGAFVYGGNALLAADPSLPLIGDTVAGSNNQTNTFTMFGGDINLWFDRFNLFGGIGIRKDDNPFLQAPNLSAKTTTAFAELDVVAYPWLLPGIRFETWNSEHAIPDPNDPTKAIASSYSDIQIVPGIVFLWRPNVKWTLRTSFIKADGDSKFQNGQTQLMMTLGI